ncbi:MAG: phytanoyl-CoA dioxygenase family protein [Gammaproteobacteria bacterium]|nr:phytanoyl-CoA dioxygenase family protein [Gammaproteobacteria bacterium]
MIVQHLPADASPADIHVLLKQDGCVVLDNVLSNDAIETILAEMKPHLNAAPMGADEFGGFNTRRTGGLIGRSPTSHAVVMQPSVLGVVDLALSHATNYQLHCTQIIEVGPDSAPQMIHRDQWAFDFFKFPPGFDTTFATMWALTDFTAENGATRVIPGSHMHEDGLQYECKDTIPAEMTRGSVLLYTGSLYHGAGENSTTDWRIGLIVHYSLAWLRQEENQYLCTPQNVLSSLPEDLLRLMGYSKGAYSLGFIDGGRDPIAAVRPEFERDADSIPEMNLKPAEV